MHKFFVAADNILEGKARLNQEDVKHIIKVLRLQVGDKVLINNCRGEEFIGVICEASKQEVWVEILEKLDINNESPINIHLFQGMPKAAKMDLIVQKAAELGVVSIVPVITKRVVVKTELSEFKKLGRYERIALEACKQSKRTIIPDIAPPIEYEELIARLKSMDLIVVPYENETGAGIKKLCNNLAHTVKNAAVVIGPEGGFEECEIEDFKGLGAHVVTLGPRILRTETAGFVCASLLQYELGDMGGR